MTSDQSPLAPGCAEVHIVAGSPEAARQVAEVLRRCFAASEQRSYPAHPNGTGTRLHLTVDTARHPQPSAKFRPWLVTSTSTGGDQPQPHHD